MRKLNVLSLIKLLFVIAIIGLITVLIVRKIVGSKDHYEIGSIVYFNPVTNQKCTDYIENNSQTGVKAGCMKWYIYKSDGHNIGLILDHNTTASIEWTNVESYDDAEPIALIEQLELDTLNWKAEADIIKAEDIINLLPWYQQLENKINWEEIYETDMNLVLDDVLSIAVYETPLEMYAAMTELLMMEHSDIALPGFLYEDLYDNCADDGSCTTYGYWTKTTNPNYPSYAWNVSQIGILNCIEFNNDVHAGIRPVISIQK